MRSHSIGDNRGTTLIEAVLYVSLLSLFLSSFLSFAYSIFGQDQRLLREIDEQSEF